MSEMYIEVIETPGRLKALEEGSDKGFCDEDDVACGA